MTMVRNRVVAILAALSAAFLMPGAAAWAVPGGSPDGKINDVHTRPGQVQFLVSVGNLPTGAVIDPKSVVVVTAGRSLRATATPADAAVDPRRAVVREAIVVLDLSASMAGSGLSAARTAALEYSRSLPPDVRVGLVTFSGKPRTLLTPTTDRGAFASAVQRASTGGGTALFDGVLAAADVLKGLPPTADRRLLILSDGQDTSSTHSIADVTSALVRGGVAADVVAFRLPGDQRSLDQIASASQGKVLPANSAGALADAFSAAAREFRQQVLVTVKVPADLAERAAVLQTSLNAGGSSVVVRTSLTLPRSPSATRAAELHAGAPAAGASSSHLWLVVLISFVALFSIALAALLLPVFRYERAEKIARIAEMSRYRIVEVAGAPGAPRATSEHGARSGVARRVLAVADRTVRARGRRERLVNELDRAGMRMRPEEWAVIQVFVVVIAGGLVALVTRSIIGLIVGGVLGWGGIRVFIRQKISRRAAEFALQLPDTLQLLAGSLRTGFSLNQALTSVVREGTEPAASEFHRALAEVRLGADLEDALDAVADRMRCEDLTWVVIAVRIAREVGGNLAEVLGTTVGTMRQRVELRGHVKALSAEGRISANVLTALPFFILGYFAVVNPKYLHPLFHTGVGIGMLAFGATLLGIGSFWLSRLIKIRV